MTQTAFIQSTFTLLHSLIFGSLEMPTSIEVSRPSTANLISTFRQRFTIAWHTSTTRTRTFWPKLITKKVSRFVSTASWFSIFSQVRRCTESLRAIVDAIEPTHWCLRVVEEGRVRALWTDTISLRQMCLWNEEVSSLLQILTCHVSGWTKQTPHCDKNFLGTAFSYSTALTKQPLDMRTRCLQRF